MAKLKVTWPVITQKQLEEVVWLRKNIRLWKKRPEEMGRRMAQGAIDQYEFALAQDEKRLGEALKRGAEGGRGAGSNSRCPCSIGWWLGGQMFRVLVLRPYF